jgi:hypothetical protein
MDWSVAKVKWNPDYLLLNIVALYTSIAEEEHFRRLIMAVFSNEPPGGFRQEDEDNASETDHCPLHRSTK